MLLASDYTHAYNRTDEIKGVFSEDQEVVWRDIRLSDFVGTWILVILHMDSGPPEPKGKLTPWMWILIGLAVTITTWCQIHGMAGFLRLIVSVIFVASYWRADVWFRENGYPASVDTLTLFGVCLFGLPLGFIVATAMIGAFEDECRREEDRKYLMATRPKRSSDSDRKI